MSLASQIAAGFARVAAEINALRSEMGRAAVFGVWAEENSTLSGNALEWAFGNGANTPQDQGVVVPVDCELFSGGLSLRQGSAIVGVYRNGTKVFDISSAGAPVVRRVSVNVSPAILFEAGDVVGFRTTSASGTSSPNQVVAWFRSV